MNEHREEALYHAARRGKGPAAQALLDDGVDPWAFLDYQGTPALVVAAGGGHTDVVRRLLVAGRTITGAPDNALPITKRAPGGTAPCPFERHSGRVVAVHSRVDTRNTFGFTAMLLAAARGHVATVALLLEHGASVDTRDSEGPYTHSTLHWALGFVESTAVGGVWGVCEDTERERKHA